MKKTRFMTAALLAVLTLGLVSCDPYNEQYNYNAYQRTVNETVKSQKKNNKVILLVAFGSTWQQAFDAFDETVAAYKKAFPSYDVFLSFSSAICINRAAAGENAADGAEMAVLSWVNEPVTKKADAPAEAPAAEAAAK